MKLFQRQGQDKKYCKEAHIQYLEAKIHELEDALAIRDCPTTKAMESKYHAVSALNTDLTELYYGHLKDWREQEAKLDARIKELEETLIAIRAINDLILDAVKMGEEEGWSGCRCTFAQKMQGDGCSICNPERAKDLTEEKPE